MGKIEIKESKKQFHSCSVFLELKIEKKLASSQVSPRIFLNRPRLLGKNYAFLNWEFDL